MNRWLEFYRQNRLFCNLLLAWSLLFFLLRTLQHFSFATNACDLSLFDYAISSTLKGLVLAEPFHGYGWSSYFAIHSKPVLFLLVPFYLFLRGPLFLLYIQVLAVGLAAVPLYLLAREKLEEKRSAVIVAVAYLLFRPLLNGLMYDFHPEMFFPLFIFSAHYFLTVRKNDPLFFIFILLALSIKEDFAIYVFFYCLWLLASSERRRAIIWAAAACVVNVVLAFAFIIPHFRQQLRIPVTYEFMSRWQDYGSTLGQIIGEGLAHPGRVLRDLNVLPNLASLSNYLLPLLLIPLLDPMVLLVLPPLLVGWLSRIPLMASFGLYYGAVMLSFLFLAMLQALTRMKRREVKGAARGRVRLSWILNLLLLFTLVNFKWNLLDPAKYRHLRDYPAVRDCLERIPAQAALAAQSALIPHVPRRRAIAMLPETGDAEYVLLHLGLNPWPLTEQRLREIDDSLRDSRRYRLVCGQGALRLYRRSGD